MTFGCVSTGDDPQRGETLTPPLKWFRMARSAVQEATFDARMRRMDPEPFGTLHVDSVRCRTGPRGHWRETVSGLLSSLGLGGPKLSEHALEVSQDLSRGQGFPFL